MEDHIRILKEAYDLLQPLRDPHLSTAARTRLIRQASEMTKSLKTPIERTPELDQLINKTRRLMFGYTD
jgi:hypothetical protein